MVRQPKLNNLAKANTFYDFNCIPIFNSSIGSLKLERKIQAEFKEYVTLSK